MATTTAVALLAPLSVLVVNSTRAQALVGFDTAGGESVCWLDTPVAGSGSGNGADADYPCLPGVPIDADGAPMQLRQAATRLPLLAALRHTWPTDAQATSYDFSGTWHTVFRYTKSALAGTPVGLLPVHTANWLDIDWPGKAELDAAKGAGKGRETVRLLEDLDRWQDDVVARLEASFEPFRGTAWYMTKGGVRAVWAERDPKLIVAEGSDAARVLIASGRFDDLAIHEGNLEAHYRGFCAAVAAATGLHVGAPPTRTTAGRPGGIDDTSPWNHTQRLPFVLRADQDPTAPGGWFRYRTFPRRHNLEAIRPLAIGEYEPVATRWQRNMAERIARGEAIPRRTGATWTGDRNRLLARAAAYVEKCEPSIHGQRGELTLAKLMRMLVGGFALTSPEAIEVLTSRTGWNDRCSPPWNDRDLWMKARHCERSASRSRDRGFMLVDREGSDGIGATESVPPPNESERNVLEAEWAELGHRTDRTNHTHATQRVLGAEPEPEEIATRASPADGGGGAGARGDHDVVYRETIPVTPNPASITTSWSDPETDPVEAVEVADPANESTSSGVGRNPAPFLPSSPSCSRHDIGNFGCGHLYSELPSDVRSDSLNGVPSSGGGLVAFSPDHAKVVFREATRVYMAEHQERRRAEWLAQNPDQPATDEAGQPTYPPPARAPWTPRTPRPAAGGVEAATATATTVAVGVAATAGSAAGAGARRRVGAFDLSGLTAAISGRLADGLGGFPEPEESIAGWDRRLSMVRTCCRAASARMFRKAPVMHEVINGRSAPMYCGERTLCPACAAYEAWRAAQSVWATEMNAGGWQSIHWRMAEIRVTAPYWRLTGSGNILSRIRAALNAGSRSRGGFAKLARIAFVGLSDATVGAAGSVVGVTLRVLYMLPGKRDIDDTDADGRPLGDFTGDVADGYEDLLEKAWLSFESKLPEPDADEGEAVEILTPPTAFATDDVVSIMRDSLRSVPAWASDRDEVFFGYAAFKGMRTVNANAAGRAVWTWIDQPPGVEKPDNPEEYRHYVDLPLDVVKERVEEMQRDGRSSRSIWSMVNDLVVTWQDAFGKYERGSTPKEPTVSWGWAKKFRGGLLPGHRPMVARAARADAIIDSLKRGLEMGPDDWNKRSADGINRLELLAAECERLYVEQNAIPDVMARLDALKERDEDGLERAMRSDGARARMARDKARAGKLAGREQAMSHVTGR